MTYNKDSMFDPVGVASLDPRVASYKRFIKENLGQPNLLQFLQSEQGKKLDPNLAGAMLVLEKLEQARDSTPKGPAPSTNVIQDVGMAALQEAQKQRMAMASQQGVAQLSNPAMANARFQGGITQPTRMAGGGIVAFADGTGSPDRPYVLPKTEVYTDTSLDEYIRNNFGNNWDNLPSQQKQDVARAYEPGYMQARERAKIRESADPRSRRDYVAPAAPAAAPAAAPSVTAVSTTPAAIAQTGAPSSIPAPTDVARGAPPAAGQGRPLVIPGQAQTPPPGKIGGPPAAPSERPGTAVAQAQSLLNDMKASAEELKPKEFEDFFGDFVRLNNEQGMGKAADSYKQVLASRENSIKSDFKQERWMAVAQAGFSMAQAAASNPQAGFLGALATGGMEGAKQYMTALKDYRKSNEKLQDAQFALAQATEDRKREDTKEARSLWEKKMDRYRAAIGNYQSSAVSLAGTLVSKETSEAIARAGREARVEYSLPTAVYRSLTTGPNALDPLEAFTKIQKASSAVQAQEARAGAKLNEDQIKLVSSVNYQMLQRRALQGDAIAQAQLRQTNMQAGIEDNPLGLQLVNPQQ